MDFKTEVNSIVEEKENVLAIMAVDTICDVMWFETLFNKKENNEDVDNSDLWGLFSVANIRFSTFKDYYLSNKEAFYSDEIENFVQSYENFISTFVNYRLYQNKEEFKEAFGKMLVSYNDLPDYFKINPIPDYRIEQYLEAK